MQVVFLLSHPGTSYSMRRVAEALCRSMPIETRLQYVLQSVPPLLNAPLPSAIVHLLYVLFLRQKLQKIAGTLPPCDILHVVDHSESFLLASTPARLRYISVYDLIPLTEKRIYRSVLSRRLGEWLYRLCVHSVPEADGVFACSYSTLLDVQRLLGVETQKLQVIPLGVDTHFFVPLDDRQRALARHKWGLERELVILHVGSNAPYKNVETVLAVVAYLRQQGHNAHLVKVGQPLSPSLQRRVLTWGLQRYVRVFPALSDTQLREWYQISDVLLFPSLREGFGLPVLEALSCATPVVIADVPALNEWASEICLSAPPQDISMLSEQVVRSAHLASDSAFRRTLREFALGYDWQTVALRYLSAYRQQEG